MTVAEHASWRLGSGPAVQRAVGTPLLFSSLILGSASRLLGGMPPLLASSLARGSCSATFVCLTAICPLIISFGAYMKPALGIRNSPFFPPGSVTVSFVSGALCWQSVWAKREDQACRSHLGIHSKAQERQCCRALTAPEHLGGLICEARGGGKEKLFTWNTFSGVLWKVH